MKMKTKFKILIAFMAVFLTNYSGWGQTINLSTITDGSTIDYTVGSDPQVKNDFSSTVLLSLPFGVGSAVSIPSGGTASVAHPGLYVAGSPANGGFFI